MRKGFNVKYTHSWEEFVFEISQIDPLAHATKEQIKIAFDRHSQEYYIKDLGHGDFEYFSISSRELYYSFNEFKKCKTIFLVKKEEAIKHLYGLCGRICLICKKLHFALSQYMDFQAKEFFDGKYDYPPPLCPLCPYHTLLLQKELRKLYRKLGNDVSREDGQKHISLACIQFLANIITYKTKNKVFKIVPSDNYFFQSVKEKSKEFKARF